MSDNQHVWDNVREVYSRAEKLKREFFSKYRKEESSNFAFFKFLLEQEDKMAAGICIGEFLEFSSREMQNDKERKDEEVQQ